MIDRTTLSPALHSSVAFLTLTRKIYMALTFCPIKSACHNKSTYGYTYTQSSVWQAGVREYFLSHTNLDVTVYVCSTISNKLPMLNNNYKPNLQVKKYNPPTLSPQGTMPILHVPFPHRPWRSVFSLIFSSWVRIGVLFSLRVTSMILSREQKVWLVLSLLVRRSMLEKKRWGGEW